MLEGKKIILGVCGSIAAYKSASLVRLLVKSGAEVQVIMTEDAKDFVTPLALSTLSKRPVFSSFKNGEEGIWNNHVDLALWADLMLIAPATANTISKMAMGSCDNLLLAIYLSAKCDVAVAPAMDLDMYKHPATIANLNRLQSFGNFVIPSNTGELASGLYGQGRMAEPEELFAWIQNRENQDQALKGKTALVTAGPTYEHIDPVRFIGNHSSGKMGFAIAEALAQKGAHVVLVTGPTSLTTEHSNIETIRVVNADAMYKACIKHFTDKDITIMTAAVADYKVAQVSEQKIKKGSEEGITLNLIKTTDILKDLGSRKTERQLLVGFALETENEEANALKKLISKNLDYIVLNSLQQPGAGFSLDTNQVVIYNKQKEKVSLPLKSKKEIAGEIVTEIMKGLHA